MPGAAKSLCCCCSCFCTALRSFTCKRSSSKMNFPGLFGHDCTVLDMLAILHHITVYSNFRYTCSYSICAASRVAAIVASGAGTVVVSWYLPGGWDMMCYKYPAVWIESSDILLLCILDVSLIPLHRGGVHHNDYIYTRDNQHILRAPRIQLRN